MSAESETGVVCFRTRREAVWLGIRYLAIVAPIACIVMFFSACTVNWRDAEHILMSCWWRSIAISIVLSLPVVVLMG